MAAISSMGAHAQETDTLSRRVQVDSLPKLAAPVTNSKVDSVHRVHSPRKAAIRSAIVPGWGQIYNKKYWKLPIVYGALGTSAYIFFDNLNTYRQFRFAYQAKYKAALPARDPNNPNQPGQFRDSTDYFKIPANLLPYPMETLRYNRDNFRRYIDYSVLFFIALWGLNVVDATVDAHLKAFDVSPNLSMRFKAGYFDVARTSGVGLVLTFK